MTGVKGSVVMVTGAGSGIGRAVAEAFVREGSLVALVERDVARLDEVTASLRGAGGEVIPFVADISAESEVRGVVETLEARFGSVDILVNNAGVGLACEIREMDLPAWRRVLEVNYFGTVYGIHAVLPGMLKRGRGHIVNVASANGLFPFPLEGAYASSKGAVIALSEVMAMELRPLGIGVTVVCPGLVRTRILEDASFGPSAPRRQLLLTIMARRGVAPEVIAKALLRGVKRGTFLVRSPFYVTVVHGLFKLLPRLYRALAGWFVRKMR